MNRAEAIQFAKRETRDGADEYEVIGELKIHGFTADEAEEILEEALIEMESET